MSADDTRDLKTALDTAASEGTFSFPSTDGRTVLFGRFWLPRDPERAAHPRGIVQIVHGMAEHSARYAAFARFLADRGYAVCAHDHIGHGKSVKDPSLFGCLPVKNGAQILVEDVHRLRGYMAELFPEGTPYILFGHSMGSFIVRVYLAHHGEGLAAAIVCGTAQQPRIASLGGGALARFLVTTRGENYRSSFLDNIGAGAYGKKIPDARTPYDWICTDSAVVDAYIADDGCGFMFSVGGYAALLDLTAEIVTPACAAGVPDGLPVLFMAGALDPVGDNGVGPKAAAEQMAKLSQARVDVKLYEGMRHEVLNEIGHERVFEDVAQWIEEHV